MKSVPLKELKRNLSTWTEEAAKGTPIEVTRYNRPYVVIIKSQQPGVRYGSLVNKAHIEPALKGGTGGKALRFLLEDREES